MAAPSDADTARGGRAHALASPAADHLSGFGLPGAQEDILHSDKTFLTRPCQYSLTTPY